MQLQMWKFRFNYQVTYLLKIRKKKRNSVAEVYDYSNIFNVIIYFQILELFCPLKGRTLKKW